MQTFHRTESKIVRGKSKYCQENGRARKGKVKKTLRTFSLSAHSKGIQKSSRG